MRSIWLRHDLETSQKRLIGRLKPYNSTRPHSGRYCYGKTPMQTFLGSKQIVQQKMLDRHYEDKIGNEMKNKQRYGDERETTQAPVVSVR